MKLLVLLLSVIFLLQAKPYTPNENEVLISFKRSFDSDKVERLKTKLKANPRNEEVLDALVTYYLKEGREKSDPRYFGYAQALLAPYMEKSDASYRIRLHNADILQHQHQFQPALKQLESLSLEYPQKAESLVMSAVIFNTQGRYQEGMYACKKLIFNASHLLSTTCITQMSSHLHSQEDAYELLLKSYQRAQHEDVQTRSWALSVISEMARRMGKTQEAKGFLKEAIRLNEKDYYAKAALSDILYEEKGYQQMIALLKGYEFVDALRLRMSMALKALGDEAYVKHMNILQEHFSKLHLREEKAHLKEEAMYTLYLKEDAYKAWLLAYENFTLQKEYADEAVFKETGLALNMSNEKIQAIMKELK